MSNRSISRESTHTRLDRFRQESVRELREETLGCAFLQCDKHPIVYSVILLSIGLILFTSLIVCILYFTETSDPADFYYDYAALKRGEASKEINVYGDGEYDEATKD